MSANSFLLWIVPSWSWSDGCCGFSFLNCSMFAVAIQSLSFSQRLAPSSYRLSPISLPRISRLSFPRFSVPRVPNIKCVSVSSSPSLGNKSTVWSTRKENFWNCFFICYLFHKSKRVNWYCVWTCFLIENSFSSNMLCFLDMQFFFLYNELRRGTFRILRCYLWLFVLAHEKTRFAEASKNANIVPLYQCIFSDQLTPVLAYRCLVKEDNREAPSFLYESVEPGSRGCTVVRACLLGVIFVGRLFLLYVLLIWSWIVCFREDTAWLELSQPWKLSPKRIRLR